MNDFQSTNQLTILSAQTWHEPADVERALDESLENLQLDYGINIRYPLKLMRETEQIPIFS